MVPAGPICSPCPICGMYPILPHGCGCCGHSTALCWGQWQKSKGQQRTLGGRIHFMVPWTLSKINNGCDPFLRVGCLQQLCAFAWNLNVFVSHQWPGMLGKMKSQKATTRQ